MTHIVYPYKLEDNDLKISIRSIYKYFNGDFDITIIGDIPDWISSEIIAIPLDNHRNNCQRQSLINQKILKAAEIYDEFLLFNDDIILKKEVSIEDFKVNRPISDTLVPTVEPIDNGSFRSQLAYSRVILEEFGIKNPKNFTAHCPYLYKSENIFMIQEHINLTPLGKFAPIFEVIYFNLFPFPKTEHTNKFRFGIWSPFAKKEFSNECIVNYDENGYNNVIIKDLLKEFNEKCEGEK